MEKKIIGGKGIEYKIFLDNEYVGHALIMEEDFLDVVNLVLLYIEREYKNQGYGRKLLSEIIQYYDEVGKSMEGIASVNKKEFNKLVEFYESFGFQKIGAIQDEGSRGYTVRIFREASLKI